MFSPSKRYRDISCSWSNSPPKLQNKRKSTSKDHKKRERRRSPSAE